MPTKIDGFKEVVRKNGRQVCTLFDFTKHAELRIGPDGANWELLSEDEVMTLAADKKVTYKHNAKERILHVCAAMSGWGFVLPGHDEGSPFELSPQSVSFLHIKRPSKLEMLAGSDSGVTYEFTGLELQTAYNQAKRAWGSYVWRRSNKDGSIEVAINFCIQKLAF